MANPPSLQITPLGTHMELNWRLYLHHNPGGPKPNQSTIISHNGTATGWGSTVVNNWEIYDGVGRGAMVVARAQGLCINAGSWDWRSSFSLVFENERFKGSTLEVMGIVVEEGEWAIVGGTGQFAMATGVIYKKRHEKWNGEGQIIELTLHGFCPLLKESKTLLTKIGPWGGNGGAVQDIIDAPQRLESITIRSGTVIDSIAFSYIDQGGRMRTAGPWGGPGGNPHMHGQIQLGSLEFVKEVCGTFGMFEGDNVINSIKIVTNEKSYGPFGRENGTPVNIPVQNNGSVVGFFGCSGTYLDALGIYVHPC